MNQQNIKNQSGLSLIELMVALVLGLVISAAVIQVFLSTRQSYRVTEAHALLQDNARFAINVLSKDIRAAGYMGCRKFPEIIARNITDPLVSASIDESTVIRGNQSTGDNNYSPAVDNANLTGLKSGTDVITVQRASSCGATLVQNMANSSDPIHVSIRNSCRFNVDGDSAVDGGDVLMISDCSYAHIFRTTSVINQGTNRQIIEFQQQANSNQIGQFCRSYIKDVDGNITGCNASEARPYGYDAEIYRYAESAYFIAEKANGVPALFRYTYSSRNPAVEELVEGIEDMQITYGVDTSGPADKMVDQYLTADAVDNQGRWDRVLSVHIELLVRTEETNLTTQAQNLTFNNAQVNSNDGRLRRVFSFTVSTRNKGQ